METTLRIVGFLLIEAFPWFHLGILAAYLEWTAPRWLPSLLMSWITRQTLKEV